METTEAAKPAAPHEPQGTAPKPEDKVPPVQDNTDVPDPDEDDLDDLDDMLDDFSNTKIDPKKAASKVTPGPDRPPAAAASTETPSVPPGDTDSIPGLEDFGEEDFQKQLQAGMAELMSEMEKSVGQITSLNT